MEEFTNVEVPSVSLSYDAVKTQVGFLQGKVLTVLEAILPEGRQFKAAKDLVNNAFREQLDWIYTITHEHTGPNGSVIMSVGQKPTLEDKEREMELLKGMFPKQ